MLNYSRVSWREPTQTVYNELCSLARNCRLVKNVFILFELLLCVVEAAATLSTHKPENIRITLDVAENETCTDWIPDCMMQDEVEMKTSIRNKWKIF